MYREKEQYTNSLYIQKVKFKFWGEPGKVTYRWDQTNGRYNEFGMDPTNWIATQKQETIYEEETPF
jgi:hypothetical protein